MTKATSHSTRSRKKTKSPSGSQKTKDLSSGSSRSRKKSSAPQSVDTIAPRGKISYDKNERTDRIITWLTDNVNDRVHLFSDNSQDATAEGTDLRTAKTSKMIYYRRIASHIFAADREEQAGYAQDPERYAKSVENHIRALKKKYREFNKALGQTGAGLRVEDIEEGTKIHNLIERLSIDFPHWKRLHGFWRTIPSFNPSTQSARHGQDLAAQAQELLGGAKKGKRKDDDNNDEDDIGEDDGGKKDKGKRTQGHDDEVDSDADDEIEVGDRDWGKVMGKGRKLAHNEGYNAGEVEDGSYRQSAPVSRLASPIVHPYLFGDSSSVASSGLSQPSRSVSRGRTSSRGKGRSSKLAAYASSAPATVEDSLIAMTGKKFEHKIAEQSAKRAKYESVSASVQAGMELRKLQQEERVLAMQHQREREKEAHELRLMQLKLAMCNPALLNPFNSQQQVLNLLEPSHLGPPVQHDVLHVGSSNVAAPGGGPSDPRPSMQREWSMNAQRDPFGPSAAGSSMRLDWPSDARFGLGPSNAGMSSQSEWPSYSGHGLPGPSTAGPSMRHEQLDVGPSDAQPDHVGVPSSRKKHSDFPA